MSEKKIETKLETAEMHNAELTGKIILPPKPVVPHPIPTAKPEAELKNDGSIKSFPEVKQYPEAPAPAPQVPPAEVGVAVTAPSGQTNPIAIGDPIKSGDYVKLDEPVKRLAQGGTLDENSRAAFEKAVSMFNNPPPTGAVSYGKFEDFKAEILRAFKHLGLDTRKHFTE